MGGPRAPLGGLDVQTPPTVMGTLLLRGRCMRKRVSCTRMRRTRERTPLTFVITASEPQTITEGSGSSSSSTLTTPDIIVVPSTFVADNYPFAAIVGAAIVATIVMAMLMRWKGPAAQSTSSTGVK